MAALTSLDDLTALLDRDGTRYALDRERHAIELATRDPSLPGDLSVRWRAPFVELVQAVLLDVPPGRARELERALAVLNDALDIPGFGYGETARRLYFRLVAPAFPPHGIDAETLYQLAEGTVRNAKRYQAAFGAVIAGRPGGDIVELAGR
jgi:hypothetical protein